MPRSLTLTFQSRVSWLEAQSRWQCGSAHISHNDFMLIVHQFIMWFSHHHVWHKAFKANSSRLSMPFPLIQISYFTPVIFFFFKEVIIPEVHMCFPWATLICFLTNLLNACNVCLLVFVKNNYIKLTLVGKHSRVLIFPPSLYYLWMIIRNM